MYMALFILLFLPSLCTFRFVPMPPLVLLTTLSKVLALVRIDYVFLEYFSFADDLGRVMLL